MDKSTEINLLTNALFRTLTAPEGKIVEFPELGILNSQNTQKPFGVHSEQTSLIINIFDFDGTLFVSPEPNPAIWESRLVGLLKNEKKIFKGWYQDERTLSCVLQGGQYRWNNQLVYTIKQSMRAKNTLTVLLTGRGYEEFHELVTEMVEREGMHFDVMGFKPGHNVLDWKSYYKTNIIQKIGRDAYEKLIMNQTTIETNKLTTKEFKTNFINDLISHYSPPVSINIWEDRDNHVKFFEEHFRKLKSLGTIQEGNVYKVVLPKMYLEPFREYDMVMSMVKDHNENFAKFPEGDIGKIGIIRKIHYAGIFFDQYVTDLLKKIYPPPNVNGEWIFDGPYIHIRHYVSNEWIDSFCGGRGAIVTMKVTGFSLYQNRIYCLRVSEYENSLAKTPPGMRCGRLYSSSPVPFICFAYVKDTEGFSKAERINFDWIECEKQIIIQGVVAAKYILGLN